MIDADQVESWVEGSYEYGMTDEQIKNFVVNSHVTDSRKLRQVLVEVERRNHERKKVELDKRRKQVRINQLEAKLEVLEDEFERELLELDIEEYRMDLMKFTVSLNQHKRELETFIEWINKNFGSMEELIDAAEYDEEEERKYWIARLGKQAALDIYASGRIGIGNLDSIAMLREEDQYASLNVALQYSGLLSAGISKIQGEIKPQLDKMMMDGSAPRIPTFDGIEDSLNLKLFENLTGSSNEQKSLQSTDQS